MMWVEMRIVILCLIAVTATAEYVWLRDLNSDHDKRHLESAGLPSTLNFQLLRGNNGPGLELHLEENTRLNANAPVFDVEPRSDGKQRLVRKESTPIKTTKFYQDKRNDGVFKVTCEVRPGGACQRKLYGNVKITGESYDLKPLPYAPNPPSLHGKRNRMSEDVLHELVPSDLGKMTAWLRSRGADSEDFSAIPGNRPQERKGLLAAQLKSILNKRKQYLIPKIWRSSTRTKRSDVTYAIEVVVVVDPALWEKYYSDTTATEDKEEATELTLRQHFAHIINGASLRFESIEDADMNIYIALSGFIFYKTVDSSNPLPPDTEIPNVDGVNYADLYVYMNSIVTWTKGLENLPHNDHIAVFTGYDLYSENTANDGAAGAAWLGGVCNDKRTSVNEDGSYFVTVSVAAHEIGHNMNASHDGTQQAKDCGEDDKYVMAPMVTSFPPDANYTINPWRFSQCSVDAFKDFVKKLGDGNCLLDQGDYYNSTEYNSHVSQLPGELYTPDEQCKLVRGETAKLYSDAESEDICTLMGCIIDGEGYYLNYAAARGTPCGITSDNKWCIEGQCVTKSDKHTGGTKDEDSSNTGGNEDDITTTTTTTTKTTTETPSANTDGTKGDDKETGSTGNGGCKDVGYHGLSCQWIADYYLASENKLTPSEWCKDSTWGEDNCCAYCSDYVPSCADVGYLGFSCQWISDYFLKSKYKATPSEWCTDQTWRENYCCEYCSVHGK